MNFDPSTLIDQLQDASVSRQFIAAALADRSRHEIHELLKHAVFLAKNEDEANDQRWLQPVLLALSQSILDGDANARDAGSSIDHIAENLADTMGDLYAALGPHHPFRYQLLSCLAQLSHVCEDPDNTKKTLEMLADRIVSDPPRGIGPATAPIIHLCREQPPHAVNALFPRLLEALANQELAPAILDLASFLARTGSAAEHPASRHFEGLLRLAEAVVADLQPIQSSLPESTEDLRTRQQRVAQNLPLAVSLCDTLGLIGDDRAIPTLQRIGELQHRRLRVESSAALIRLADRNGNQVVLEEATQHLVAMAAEPSVRSRVLSYAEELDVASEVSEAFDTPAARAEGDLIAFLAQPTQMGLPPVRCELVDSRTLYWPGYEEPRNCFLFRFEYEIAGDPPSSRDRAGDPTTAPPAALRKTYTNLGIAGPVVHVFPTHLLDLSYRDVYSLFAGWQAEHEAIRHQAIDQNTDPALLPNSIKKLVSRIPEDFDAVRPKIFGMFFNQPVVIASARKGTAIGTLAMGDLPDEPEWFPQVHSRDPGPDEVWSIYKGRRLLDSFNTDWRDE